MPALPLGKNEAIESLRLACHSSSGLEASSFLIAVSKAVRDDLMKRGLRRSSIYLVYNGIKMAARQSVFDKIAARRELGFSEGGFIIGSVGRLVTVKGHSYLIEAMPSILNENKDCQLIIAGDGPLKADLEALITKLGLSDNVILAGHIDNIDKFMDTIDLFVLPSLSEGLPMALLEAMAYQKPVLASDVGGIPEVITNTSEGIMIVHSNADAISSAVCRLLQDRAQLKWLGGNSRKRVESAFSSSRMAMEYADIYAGLTNPSGSSAFGKTDNSPG